MIALPTSLLAFGMPGGTEWIILLVLGLLIFGRRLPEVGRSLGRGIVEFKKGIRGIEDEIEDASTGSSKLEKDGSAALDAAGDTPRVTPMGEVQRTKVSGESANPYQPSPERPADG